MFCGQCGTEIKENDGFCTVCGREAVARKVKVEEKQQPKQSVNNWSDLYKSAKKLPKKKPRKKATVKKEEEETLVEYEKDYLKRLNKKPRKKATDYAVDEMKQARRKKILKAHPDRGGSDEELKKVLEESKKHVSSSALPQSSFSPSKATSFLIKFGIFTAFGFLFGFLMYASGW